MKKIQLFLMLIIATMVVAQDNTTDDIMKKANDALSNYQLDKAVKLYEEASASNPLAKEKLASIYAAPGSMQDVNKAVSLYEEVFNTGSMTGTGLARYANLLETQNNFDKARSVYNFTSNKGLSANSLVRNLAPGYFTKLNETNNGIVIKNIDDINTANSDFSPMFYRDGLSFVSTRKNRSKTGYRSQDEIVSNFTDVFKAKFKDKVNGTFESPEGLLKAGDQKYMQGPMTFSDQYGVMYMTRSTAKDGKSFAMDNSKVVLMEICKVNYSNGDVENWDDVIPTVLNRGEGYQNFSYAHPAFVTGAGTEMIFSSNMPGGFGGTDLWYTRLVGSEWSAPVNLGSDINTAGDEEFPFVSQSGNLYYASNGLPGLGGLDIFKAKNMGEGLYGEVENIGAPYNSKYDDFGMILDETEREGYFSSNRPGGKGLDDIYSWKTNETQLCVKVVEKLTKNPIANATVKIPCLGSKTYNTDANGMACLTVTALKNCDIKAGADGYTNNSLTANNLQSNKIIEIPLDKDLVDRCKFVIKVIDKETNLPISDANVNIRQTSTNEAIDGETKEEGIIRVKGVSMDEFYEINASKTLPDGSRYIGIPESAICRNMQNGDSLIKIIYLRKAMQGSTFEIENIYYDVNKWNIRPDAAVELDKIAQLLRQYPSMEIEMGSHTDCRATARYNEELSSKRAASCVEYLINKGIAANRLSSKGYGESQLKNGCACEGRVKSSCTEQQHQQNRRTEFKIIRF